MSDRELPQGWARCRVDEAGTVQLGRQRSPDNHFGPYMRPYLRVANVYEDRIDLSDVMEMNFTPDEAAVFQLKPGDILLNEGQSKELVGRPALYRDELPGACFTNSLVRFKSGPGVLSGYALHLFRHWLRSGEFQKIAQITTNIAHLGAGRFAGMVMPLAPLNEQHRIVAKIEELTDRSRRAREALDAVPALLDRFRQSVLAAAFRGDLTAEWRASRRLPAAPYKQLALRDLVREPLRNGKSVRDGDGPMVLRLSSLRKGTIDWTEAKSGDWGGIDVGRFLVEDGDFLVARGNGSRDLVGRGGLVNGAPPKMAFPDTMIRIRPDTSQIHPQFLKLVWDSADVRKHIEFAARTSAGIWKVSQPDLEALLVPVPDLLEQEEIARRAAELLGLSETLSARCNSVRADAERLSESILAQAFRGELVPQDPSDEPASVLLERIRGERAEAVVPKAKRGRKPRELAGRT